MLKICCVRHGESAANAGAATNNPATIPLTDIGRGQASALARSIVAPPDLIVVSPFIRACQTAEPSIAKFPSTSVEIWPVQEFTYLSPVKSEGTTASQRRPRVLAYWSAADVDYEDGDGAESFVSFMARVQVAKQQIEGLHERGVQQILLIGHGQFWQALRAMLKGELRVVNQEAMHAFRRLEEVQTIPNGGGFSAEWDGCVWSEIYPLPLE